MPRSKDECLKEWNVICKKNAEIAAAKYDDNKEEETKVIEEDKKDNEGWSPDEIKDLQAALKKFNSKMEKNERWSKISRFVATKNKKECVEKYKEIRSSLKK